MENLIKYRGYSLSHKEWFYAQNGVKPKEMNAKVITLKTFFLNVEHGEIEGVGQFTGAKDMDGKEIYTGDVYKDKFGGTGLITFCNDKLSFMAGNCHLCGRADLLEVFTNVYESPEWFNG